MTPVEHDRAFLTDTRKEGLRLKLLQENHSNFSQYHYYKWGVFSRLRYLVPKKKIY